MILARPPQSIGKAALAVAVASAEWHFPLDFGMRYHLCCFAAPHFRVLNASRPFDEHLQS